MTRIAIRAGRMNGLKIPGTRGDSAQARRVGPHAGMGIVIAVVQVLMPGAAFVRLAQGDAPVTLDEAFAWAAASAG
ncbi:hypothetical protein [Burkholderia catarinensis]|uniref:hypothetical protein n=1 Tax=Burkholderia catarinensis TaxID=1108140 RepID=UPI001008488E|nr:hypothetical protein [Burkholderia catarinensis]